MTPYWITIKRQSKPTPLNIGAGITAVSVADAEGLFKAALGSTLEIATVEPITDMRDIEPRHVAPNMGSWFKRGVWYPLGYEHTAAAHPAFR